MKELSVFEHAGSLVVDSRLIAERLGIEHRSFLQTLRDYETVIQQAFGILRFENAEIEGRGRPGRYALLTEDQATFVMTLSRNTPEVVECKLQLVQAFSKAKEHLKHRSMRGAYWYERIRIALSDPILPLGQGYFCAYLEMMKFFQELEVHAKYVVPDVNPKTEKYIVPDISIGQRFNRWLRSEDEDVKQVRIDFLGTDEPIDFRPERLNKDKSTGLKVRVAAGSHNHEIVKYNHVYPEASHGENNVHDVNSYPDKYLPIFKYYLSNVWIPKHCNKYISERDSEGWSFAMNNLLQMPATARIGLSKTLIGALIPALPQAS